MKDDSKKILGINWISRNASGTWMISHFKPRFNNDLLWINRAPKHIRNQQYYYDYIESVESFRVLGVSCTYCFGVGVRREVIISETFYQKKTLICTISPIHDHYKKPNLKPHTTYYVYERR